MATSKSFYQILLAKKSENLLLQLSQDFMTVQIHWLKKPLLKATLMVNQHLNKGYEHRNQQSLTRYLGHANDQLIKVRSMLELAIQMELVVSSKLQVLQEQAIELNILIQGLIRQLIQTKSVKRIA